MIKEQVNVLLAKYNKKEVINRLAEDVKYDYDEYTMLKLAEVYYDSGNIKESKKLIKKMQRLFPMGEYYEKIKKLLEKIEETKDITQIEKDRNYSVASKLETGIVREDDFDENMNNEEIIIPESIDSYFDDTIGLEFVKKEIGSLYDLLCLQNDRKNRNYNPNLIETSHFAIIGNRGSGKTMIANIICKLLYTFKINSNSEAVLIRGREIAKAFYDSGEKGINKLFSEISNKSIIIENYEEIMLEYEDINFRTIAICLENIMKQHQLDSSIIITGNSESIQNLLSVDDTFSDILYSIITIKKYSPEELIYIADKLATERALKIQDNAKKSLKQVIEREFNNAEFMNAITLKRYIDNAIERMAQRYKKIKHAEKDNVSDKDMIYLLDEDFGFDEINSKKSDELMGELDELIGLESVKQEIKKQINFIKVAKNASKTGVEVKSINGSNHMLFIGNPGTGKTTVAKLIGKIYYNLGILSKGHTIMCTRSDLVAKYVGHTAINVKNKFKQAMGGVLFIDEAYALKQSERDEFGQEAIDELTQRIEENRNNLVVILAGYPDNMDEFIKSNEGLKSRFRKKIIFEDYTVKDMINIFKNMVKQSNMKLENGIDDLLYNLILSRSKETKFGNARGVRNIYEDVLDARNERLSKGYITMSTDKTFYETIIAEDLNKIFKNKKDVKKTLDELLDELNGLTGLESVKKKINEMVQTIKVHTQMKAQGLEVTEQFGTLHLVFKGNAGTGKTTVARLLGQIYRELGILKKDVFKEVQRKDLVEKYQGQSAKKVEKIVKEAEGGILFIDEAYSLDLGEHDTFGHEVIDTLVPLLENKKDNLMVILAGYSKEMDSFLEANQGLYSRLSNEIFFDDYTMDELIDIFKWMVADKKLILNFEFENIIKEQIIREKKSNKDFGNARGVRNLLDRIILKMNVRLGKSIDAGETLTKEDFITLVKEDFIIN